MFRFKQFCVEQELCAMKVGTDGVLLGAWAQGGECILDIGTGTGLIALMMAQRNPASNVMAIDIDEGAFRQATFNVEQSPFRHQVVVKQESVQEHQGQYESIVCNPPYFIDALHAPDLQRSIARHTDTLSYADLMQAAYRLLTDDGEFSVIVPFDYRKRMEDEAVFVGFFPRRVLGFRTSERKPIKRYLLSFVKHPMATENSIMTFEEEAYKELTKDFYL